MDFFEALSKRAKARLGDPAKYKVQGKIAEEMYETVIIGINATILALKEMMVKQPFPRILKTDGKRDTWIMNPDGEVMVHFWGVHGTDGEEVVVMVFKKP